MNTLETRSTPNKPAFQLAGGLFSTLTAVALLASCNRSYDDPINRAEIAALQLQASEEGLPSDCSYLYTHLGNNAFVLNGNLDKQGLSKAAQELTAQNNMLVVPPSLTGGKTTDLSELQKDVIGISSQAIAGTMEVPPSGMSYYPDIAVCPSSNVLKDQRAHVVVLSPNLHLP